MGLRAKIFLGIFLGAIILAGALAVPAKKQEKNTPKNHYYRGVLVNDKYFNCQAPIVVGLDWIEDVELLKEPIRRARISCYFKGFGCVEAIGLYQQDFLVQCSDGLKNSN